jgi:hypothetical protein
MSLRRGVVVLVVAVGATSVAVAPALGRDDETLDVWATVNVCDTKAAPDTIGIRASMPGSKDGREGMFMRFQVQYYSESDDRWRRVSDAADARFMSLGKGRKARQAGRSLRINPKSSDELTLRGRVFFEWRLDGDVVRKAQATTTKGHRSTAGADPEGYTAATCTIMPGEPK